MKTEKHYYITGNISLVYDTLDGIQTCLRSISEFNRCETAVGATPSSCIRTLFAASPKTSFTESNLTEEIELFGCNLESKRLSVKI